MSNDILAALGVSLSNIGAAIAQNLDSDTPAHEVFDECLNVEALRLAVDGKHAAASAIQTMRSPIMRLLREGW
ncbi:hypothetical protein [Sphingorhabdus sp.]|uniref:hypothetical protein n=1 Tax=Sphingorhabdus sp. TaxID=1902408 RepID=UPI0039190A08